MGQLDDQIQRRYLEYSVSVITSRALPDARDGLKPVQRRILYAMWKDLGLKPGVKHRKSAAIVGSALGRYHPHGDSAVYEAMVRMAQSFSLRYPLVHPHGNFGSVDGDPAASMRYTSARLATLSERLLEELPSNTVPFQDNYDSTTQEPVVMPAQFPNLLANGAQGIAVGMATNIPPHNLTELCQALAALLENPELTVAQLVEDYIKGPDFPTGALIVEGDADITQVYQEGSGSLTLRSQWRLEEGEQGKQHIVIYELPYQENKAKIFEKVAQDVYDGEIPQITEVRDESTDDIRLVFVLKKGADPETALAYLFKNTSLETKFHYNLTCLLPQYDTKGECQGLVPKKCDLKELLVSFLEHRKAVVRKRLVYELENVESRLHILEAFETVLEDLDALIALIRQSTDKKSSIASVAQHFDLDDAQAEAVVSQALYRLAATQIEDILAQLKLKRQEQARLKELLTDEGKFQALIQSELEAVQQAHGDARRTLIGSGEAKSFEYEEEAYIASEDVFVVLSREGWIRTQKSYSDLSALRCRDLDEIGWVHAANTRDTFVIFTSVGRAYTIRVADLPLTTGYGDPIQTLFSFEDGERVVGTALCLLDTKPDWEMVSISTDGYGVRFGLDGYEDPSQTTGRLYHRVAEGAAVVSVEKLNPDSWVVLATRHGRGITFDPMELRSYKGAGKGIRVIRLDGKNEVLAWTLCGASEDHNLLVETNRGAERMITQNTYEPQKRGGKGYHIIKRGHLVKWRRAPVEEK